MLTNILFFVFFGSNRNLFSFASSHNLNCACRLPPISIIFAFALTYMPYTNLQITHWCVLALIVSVFGPIGDLVESLLKREKQAKDSGSLLPGHGGFLDRFDAFIFHLPFCAIYLFWFVNK